MARAVKACMTLLVCHILEQVLCAFNISLKYHVPEGPSAIAFYPGLSTDVIPAFSNFQCASACLASECVGFSFQANECYLEGVGNATGLNVVGPQMFGQWTVNRAFLRPVVAMTEGIYPRALPENAVDEKACVEFSDRRQGCCYATYMRKKRFLVVDLGALMKVHIVVVGVNFMFDTEVRVGQHEIPDLITSKDLSSYELLGHYNITKVKKAWVKFAKRGGILGRYVSIQQIPYANFFVCDVIVLADD